MNVLVVARTRMSGDRVCVGGIGLETGRSLRLLRSDGRNLHENREIRPGEVWDLTYRDHPSRKPPHVEDVIVSHGTPLRIVTDIHAELLTLVEPWRGPLESIFDGRLRTNANGRAY